MFKITAKQASMQPSITDNADSRGITTGLWDLNPQLERPRVPQEYSEKIPEIWKNTNFESMPFTIEKCRDLK